ncbi:hypothetical protein PCASD_22624 [Puccinia coronata f. sp. avenae]|uniref:Uncharacterized protein n=1 Tax=Puccinia coronata f. sp. avenae TaxID=200324 RepID=A0A2N5S9E3_9BASI|nr:hypothetical protein PCASD_22624 [Puccinia coronata f. sp. avenae]
MNLFWMIVPSPHDLSESAGRLSSKSDLQKPAGVVYLLPVTIRGKIGLKDSRIGLNGLISAPWTSLLSSHDLSQLATLDLQRQMDGENAGDAAVPRSVDDLAELFSVADLILPGGYENEQHVKRSTLPHGGLVAGSKQHMYGLQPKQLSSLAFGNDSRFDHQKTHHERPSLPGSPKFSVEFGQFIQEDDHQPMQVNNEDEFSKDVDTELSRRPAVLPSVRLVLYPCPQLRVCCESVTRDADDSIRKIVINTLFFLTACDGLEAILTQLRVSARFITPELEAKGMFGGERASGRGGRAGEQAGDQHLPPRVSQLHRHAHRQRAGAHAARVQQEHFL